MGANELTCTHTCKYPYLTAGSGCGCGIVHRLSGLGLGMPGCGIVVASHDQPVYGTHKSRFHPTWDKIGESPCSGQSQLDRDGFSNEKRDRWVILVMALVVALWHWLLHWSWHPGHGVGPGIIASVIVLVVALLCWL